MRGCETVAARGARAMFAPVQFVRVHGDVAFQDSGSACAMLDVWGCSNLIWNTFFMCVLLCAKVLLQYRLIPAGPRVRNQIARRLHRGLVRLGWQPRQL